GRAGRGRRCREFMNRQRRSRTILQSNQPQPHLIWELGPETASEFHVLDPLKKPCLGLFEPDAQARVRPVRASSKSGILRHHTSKYDAKPELVNRIIEPVCNFSL